MLSTLLAIATLAPAIIPVAANVQYAGVNIAGFDFGCSTDVISHSPSHSKATTDDIRAPATLEIPSHPSVATDKGMASAT